MKISNRYVLAAVVSALFCLGWILTSETEVQINVRSGMLRRRQTSFGVQTYISDPTSNALSRAAKRDSTGSDWLTVSTRSINRKPCKEDYKTLIICVSHICEGSGNQEESKEFARSVLGELNATRSLSQTTRHVLRVLDIPFTANNSPTLIEAWKTTAQDPAITSLSPLKEAKSQVPE